MDAAQFAQEFRQQIQPQGVRAIRQGLLRRIVDLNKNPRDTHRHGRRSQRFNELRLSARCRASSARKLHAVRGIEDNRPAGIRHHLQPAHIHHQIVVAKGRSALGQHHLPVSSGSNFLRRMVDVVRRDELPLLHIDNAPGAPGFEEQIGLAAKERRDLNDIHHFRRRPI